MSTNLSWLVPTPRLAHTIRAALAILFLMLGPFGQELSAQVNGIGNTTSTPVPGVPHDYLTGIDEVVNSANGALSVRIKAQTPHERGANWPTYVYIYDLNQQYKLKPTWQTASTGSGTVANLTALNYIGEAPLVNSQITNATITLPSGQYTTMTYGCAIPFSYMFLDPDGGLHSLGMEAVSPSTVNAPVGNYSPFQVAFNQFTGGDMQYKAHTANPTSNPVLTVMIRIIRCRHSQERPS